ncbi:MAG: DMT family transporter [Paramuribaculum sp.]|nr:DMT family transporter [Bacteroides sp.]MDE7460035.1 DMT family transporter [Paramuribaculum sp.]
MTRISVTRKIEKKPVLIYHIGALIAVTAWGAAFISTKILLQNGLSAVEIYVYRFLLAYIFTLVICPKPFFSNSLRHEMMFLLCGVCGGSVYFIAENTAVEYTLVSNVSLITATSPLLTTMLVAMLYKSERVSRPMIIGSLVALAGVGCVIFNSSVVVKVNPLGDMLALLAAICWAVYSVILRPLSALYGTWFITRKTFFYGIVTALPFMMMESTHAPLEVLLERDVMFNMLFLGLFASLTAYLLWSGAVKHLGAVKSGNYLYVSPIVTLVMSALILHEGVSAVGYIGCSLILIGLILSEKLGDRHNEKTK